MSEVRYFLKKTAGGNDLELKGDVSVGRGTDCFIKLTEGNPSRHHARFSLTDGAMFLEDLKSTNGTFVNGTRIESRTRLANSDKVRFDIEEYVFRVEAPVAVLTDSDRTSLGPARVVAQSATSTAPPAWTEQDKTGGNKTVFKSIEQMEEERKRARARASDAGENGPVQVPQLIMYDGGGLPLTVQLRIVDPSKCEWSVGSDEGREIRIQRDGVSGLHAKIVNAGKQWKVVDQVSGNGTFVNGKRVNVSYLNSGDRIAFGPAECVFQAPGSANIPRSSADSSAGKDAPAGQRSKRGLVIVGLSFIATLIVLIVLLKWFG